ncbi:molybdopterin converting factor, subunit 2 [Peptoclostridium acidaminophilum DSM 3953]|uniref:Molybdopterin converting factor, subunit 2 n=1 Tax=Peptoclostridium acidaminophilum DSM 3953 TaxID=1286171 RepID=W8T893_PEPAC|nr:ThiF family adenylyltransferase [Peptoclostridium acidaminophilum]AHM57095.1 molybdopterin converting factor, subunit 2 [Peptoclostridium acidaminophilum DSM 3953]
MRYTKDIGAISMQEHELIRNKKILVAGCGSVGGFVIEGFARLGVGRMMAVDNEAFVISNLNRQPFSTEKNIGKEKVYVARERVKEINSDVLFSGINDDIRSVKIEGVDFIFDCSSNMDTKLFLRELSNETSTPLVSASIGGWKGAVCICPPKGELFEREYAAYARELLEKGSMTYFTASFAASIMIARTLQVIIGRTELGEGETIRFDMENFKF